MSDATLTTSKLVEVPIVVVMPPNNVAKPIGIKMPDGELLVRIATFSMIGNNKTTIGVLFTTALSSAETTNVISIDNSGLTPHSFANILPTGSSAHNAVTCHHQTANGNECFMTKAREKGDRV